MWCCQSKHCLESIKTEFVQTALENGCDCNVKNGNGKTACDLAMENGYYELAEMIKPQR